MERKERGNCCGFGFLVFLVFFLNASALLILSLAPAPPPWVYSHGPVLILLETLTTF